MSEPFQDYPWNLTLRLQSRAYLTSGPKVGIIFILGDLGYTEAGDSNVVPFWVCYCFLVRDNNNDDNVLPNKELH